MATYAARITAVTLVGTQLRVDGVLLEDDVEFGNMPTVSLDAATATVLEGVALVRTEIEKFRDSRSLEAQMQQYIGQEVTLP